MKSDPSVAEEPAAVGIALLVLLALSGCEQKTFVTPRTAYDYCLSTRDTDICKLATAEMQARASSGVAP